MSGQKRAISGVLAVGLAVLLGSAGCGGPSTPFSAPSTTILRPAAASASPEVTPSTIELTGFVGCFEFDPGYTPAAIEAAPADAEKATDGPAAALRTLIEAQPSLPQAGWKHVFQSSSLTIFLHPGDAQVQYWEATFEIGGHLDWEPRNWGPCSLQVTPPSGFADATWTLDPAFPLVSTATELHMLVRQPSCNGGAALDGHIAFHVGYGSGTVTITLFVRRLGTGPTTCQGTRPTPFVVRLDAPLGARALLDGMMYPAEAPLAPDPAWR
jgi:hypothetical protein